MPDLERFLSIIINIRKQMNNSPGGWESMSILSVIPACMGYSVPFREQSHALSAVH